MMSGVAFPLAVIIAVASYLVIILLMPKRFMQQRTQHLKYAMQRLEEQKRRALDKGKTPAKSLARTHLESSLIVKAFMSTPGSDHVVNFLEQAGLIAYMDRIVGIAAAAVVIFTFLLYPTFNFLSPFVSITLVFIACYIVIKARVKKRRQAFLQMLPDALDIIIRSVKSGYPINAAIGMVADSLPEEIGSEYLRIMHEASYGYSLSEAVTRFARRIQEPDVNFLAVVINLQQETGGNLTEALSNLVAVIRSRQQLKLKVRALSSEGKMTVIILVGIAACMVGAVQLMSPGHFDKLLYTEPGHMVMSVVGTIFAIAGFFIHRIVNFKV